VSTGGIITTVVGGGKNALTEGAAATDVALNTPAGVAVDSAGNLFIGDRGLSRILKLSPSGRLTTVAGTGKADFSGDSGPATQAAINNPQAIAVDSAGAIYFADQNNHRIRRIGPDGTITTVAGSGPFG